MLKGPNFFVVGAAKCGTTTLYHYLDKHLEIYLPTCKEPNFFITDYEKGINFYLDKYYSGIENHHIAAGDMSIHYLDFTYTAELISRHFPDAKIIIMLRNPVDRAWSHYLMTRDITIRESLGFDEAMAICKKQNSDYLFSWENRKNLEYGKKMFHPYSRDSIVLRPYLHIGKYAKLIAVYQQHFPKKNILLCFLDDLITNPKDFLDVIFEFIGIHAQKWPLNMEARNQYRKMLRSLIIKRVGHKNFDRFGQIAKKVLPAAFFIKLKNALRKGKIISKEIMDNDTRRKLVAYYRPWNRMLEKLIDKDLSIWDM